jgi:hypothetical protein
MEKYLNIRIISIYMIFDKVRLYEYKIDIEVD